MTVSGCALPSAIFVIFITSIWPIIINTSVGVRNIPQDYRNVAQVLRLNHFEFFWKIMVPSAAPYIFTGLRIGAPTQRLSEATDKLRLAVGADASEWLRMLEDEAPALIARCRAKREESAE